MDSYKIIKKIAEGAHGVVIRAKNIQTGEDVALKRIRIRKLEDGIPLSLLREIHILKQIDCENVVHLLDVIPESGACILVFEFMPSGLWEMIYDPQIQITQAQIKTYMFMILKGLVYLHHLKIMHRDLKPSNLVIDKNGILKIADLGLGRIFYKNRREAYSHQVATRWYRAPELLYGARYYDEGVDMWAVGCILAEMFNRAPLFPGDSDIEQLVLVIRMLGTPTEERWPGMTELPDYNKIIFPHNDGIPLEKVLPDASKISIDFVSRLLEYDSKKRMAANEALLHEYFFSNPRKCPEKKMPIPDTNHREKAFGRREYSIHISNTDLFQDLNQIVQ